MEWSDWVEYLGELVGIDYEAKKVSLLVPKGSYDLTRNEADELSNVLHKRLFLSNNSTREELKRLAREPIKYSLPLLYFSAWLVRYQEDTHAFWPYFRDAVVRNKLADGTIQQQIAPLITNLWRKMHQTYGIYRPQEGYVHIKWPQAHAGLTSPEIETILNVLIKYIGWSETPVDILYAEPDYFLNSLRIWLQQDYHIPRRLRRLIFGADGPALVVAELAQRSLIDEWPSGKPLVGQSTTEPRLGLPYLIIDPSALQLKVVFPEGEVIGYTNLKASFGNDEVMLDTAYFDRNNRTRYKYYEWNISRFPWSRQIVLIGEDTKKEIPVSPTCPFDRSHHGVMMFDFNTRRNIKRWRPQQQYYLLIPKGYFPDWIYDLFCDFEILDGMKIGENPLMLLSVIGRDILSELGRGQTTELLHNMEEQLQRSGALITLPDLFDLLQPEVLFCGGIRTMDGFQPTFLNGYPPQILIKNISDNEINLTIYKQEDEGTESLITSIPLSTNNSEDLIILQLPKLDIGLYVVRGIREPKYIRIVSIPSGNPHGMMDIKLTLLRSELATIPDDIRHFEDKGALITSWPYARVNLMVYTESGTHTYHLSMSEEGEKIITARDFQVSPTTKWIRLQATSWLAQSEIIDLSVKPYVPTDNWEFKNSEFNAFVRGVDFNTLYRLSFIYDKPWILPIVETQNTIAHDFIVRFMLKTLPRKGWILLLNNETNEPWLVTRIDDSDIEYSVSDFNYLFQHEFELPEYVKANAHLDNKLQELDCLTHLAQIAKQALIPSEESPISDNLWQLVLEQSVLSSNINVLLPPSLGGKEAEIIPSIGGNDGTLLVDERRFNVYLTYSNRYVKITWAEQSIPCKCSHCGKVMTQGEWHHHRCITYPSGFSIISKEFWSERVIDWPCTMTMIEQSLLKPISQQTNTPPRGLEFLWVDLQKAYRTLANAEKESPEIWIKGVFQSWHQLYKLVNRQLSPQSWISLSELIKPYEVGVKIVASLREI